MPTEYERGSEPDFLKREDISDTQSAVFRKSNDINPYIITFNISDRQANIKYTRYKKTQSGLIRGQTWFIIIQQNKSPYTVYTRV